MLQQYAVIHLVCKCYTKTSDKSFSIFTKTLQSMIPQKLYIKNFLSYGELQEINFAPYQLICLSGKNGHGKSALLDAITWTLWGQARKIMSASRADEGLMRLGQKNMMVALDFIIGDQQYRVRREFTRSGSKGILNLEFGMVRDTTLVPLTDKTVRATQQRIEEVIRLSYTSFVNSAFLRQGQANEFSKKSPKERKEVFASILGLDVLDRVKRLALEQSRLLQTDQQVQLMMIKQTEEVINSKTEIAQQEIDIKGLLAQCNIKEQELTKQRLVLHTQYRKYVSKQEQHEAIHAKIDQLNRDQQDAQNQIRIIRTEWRTIHQKQLASAATNLSKYKAECLQTISTHQKEHQALLSLKEQLLLVKQTRDTNERAHHESISQSLEQKGEELAQVRTELQQISSSIITLDTQHKKLKHEYQQLQDEVTKLDLSIQQHDHLEKIITDQTAIFEKRHAHYQRWVTLKKMLEQNSTDLLQKQQLANDNAGPCCPLCEQNLSAARRRFLQTKFLHEEEAIRHRQVRFIRILPLLKEQLIQQHKNIEQYKKDLQTTKTTIQRLRDIEVQSEHLLLEQDTAHTQIVTLKHREKQLQQRIDNTESNIKSFILNAKIEYQQSDLHQRFIQQEEALTRAIASCAYNQSALEQAQQELADIEQQDLAQAQLRSLTAHQPVRRQKIEHWCDILRSIKKNIYSAQNELKDYQQVNQQLKTIEEQIKHLDNEHQAITTQKEQFLQQQGCIESEKRLLEQQRLSLTLHQKQIAQIQESLIDYQTLAHAAGKDGIQALLIEGAIPEVETEANRLLSKLTYNQAQLLIESVRDLKRGGTKETLDINICDAMGIRPYEMFSGGEAFRIDFALRIAISKLLARRAGTALQTLIIDEGFGSQDEEGLNLIMEALLAIQDDFEKVIIVSHLHHLKDQFPVHFIIEKGAQGSTVQITELA